MRHKLDGRQPSDPQVIFAINRPLIDDDLHQEANKALALFLSVVVTPIQQLKP